MKTFTASAVASLVLLLAGCAQLRPVSAPATATPAQTSSSETDYWMKSGQIKPSSKTVALLYYADYVRDLNATDYSQETEHARLLATVEKSDFRQLQYALALTVSGGETRKAQQVIDNLIKDSKFQDPELIALAQMINSDLAERRRLEAANRKGETDGRRVDELEKKVEALKNIEKNLIQRDRSTVEKP